MGLTYTPVNGNFSRTGIINTYKITALDYLTNEVIELPDQRTPTGEEACYKAALAAPAHVDNFTATMQGARQHSFILRRAMFIEEVS